MSDNSLVNANDCNSFEIEVKKGQRKILLYKTYTIPNQLSHEINVKIK